MNKTLWLAALAGFVIVAGCGKQSPLAPKETAQANTVKTQAYEPDECIYKGVFGGTPGMKPWYWRDADDDSSFNATIRTCANSQSAHITRVNTGSTWGKVGTFSIKPGSNFNHVRIFVPSCSANVTWKLIAREEYGEERWQVIQDSTTQTGYLDYDITSFLDLGIWGPYVLEIIVEGAVGEYIEVAELYVYAPDSNYSESPGYWVENFGIDLPLPEGAHTAGWFDDTTHPDFDATIVNISGHRGLITPLVLGGKVLGPVIPWKASKCVTLEIGIDDCDPGAFAVVIQEQAGSYRRFVMAKTFSTTPTPHWTIDLTGITGMADGTPFSVAIEGVQRTLTVSYIKLDE